MKVFEDLIVELKAENLLERTDTDIESDGFDEIEDTPYLTEPSIDDDFESSDGAGSSLSDAESSERYDEVGPVVSNTSVADRSPVLKPTMDADYYHKRAVSEVSSLQMVEHVLTGVEREYLKVAPKTFDDLDAKKALHTFLSIASEVGSEECATAEFNLMRETEAWCSALSVRDRDIPVASLRMYCENSRPALSSQALVGLTRFYRNLPFSEQVRSKFDFAITRLFSRAGENDSRVCLFTREEMLTHVNTLYREWASIPLYTADDDESKVMLAALSFEELAIEAESATRFDQLIHSDFFGRLRLFKESISELFFAPSVTVAAIECNIRIGNAYVKLISLERSKMDDASVESKYADINEQAVSDAAARTLKLVDLLRSRATAPAKPGIETPPQKPEVRQRVLPTVTKVPDRVQSTAPEPTSEKLSLTQRLRSLGENAFSVNRWFLAVSILIVIASVGLWVWANYVVQEEVSSAGVQNVHLEGTVLNDHIKSARVSRGTLYGSLGPNWDALPKEKRQEFLQKVLESGPALGFEQVNLINKHGRLAAFASPTRLEVIMY